MQTRQGPSTCAFPALRRNTECFHELLFLSRGRERTLQGFQMQDKEDSVNGSRETMHLGHSLTHLEENVSSDHK